MKARQAPRTKTMTREFNRSRMVQLLTMRDNLDNVTAAEIARWTGVPEAEAGAALERERLFRMKRG